MKNKGGFIGFVLFVVLLLADLVSTLLLWDLIKYLEANPLYHHIGLTGIVMLNLMVCGLIYYIYVRSSKPSNRFLCMNVLVTVALIRIVAVVHNFQVWMSKPTLQAAQAVTKEAKQATIVSFWWTSFIPYLIAIVTYYLFRIDHIIKIKEK